MDTVNLIDIELKINKYKLILNFNSSNDLKISLVIKQQIIDNYNIINSHNIDNVKIDYNLWYGEIALNKKYTINFEITNKNTYNLKININKNISNYEFVSYQILSNDNDIIYDSLNNFNSLLLTNINNNYNFENSNGKYKYPLISNTFDSTEIVEMNKFLISGAQLTMGSKVEKFESEFAKYIGSNYAIMVNSGSSANLLAIAAISNFMFDGHLNIGDEVLVPTLCWSTTVWPLLQFGLKPVFIDIKKETMNINEELIEKYITDKTKAIMLVHVMGNCCDMENLMKITQKYNLFLIEDTCESLGSSFNNNKLGSFGNFGTFSFYYSHHITTIEGDMVTTNTKKNYDLLRCLRAHGWTRYHDDDEQQKYNTLYSDIDSRYMFVNMGFNFRPMEMQAVMGSIQLTKLDHKNINRIYNYENIKNKILNHPLNTNIITIPTKLDKSYIAWFGFCFYINKNLMHKRKDYIQYLEQNLIENRPIITGNFTR